MLATAKRHEASLWTQDADFEAIEGVRYIAASARKGAG
jgi:predicted nucleic acid-binding protein